MVHCKQREERKAEAARVRRRRAKPGRAGPATNLWRIAEALEGLVTASPAIRSSYAI
ncbi:hypothetical protein CERZMDRAFT_103431 [Cercospora zeae-maydis SCOH1-5]|uniref:Uncharacterized protein n=1 Tax=Cercospora zeae-maydis SCOH1-5 TaxID=717836 RepID=A0A6A6EXE6_9PEZI|nr:hypothetical protein CERZMDRAFT_103431 [Cercospora zeae-maydis SCOH1-5]